MIPVSDDVRARSFPIVNVSIIIARTLVFLYELPLSATPPIASFDYAVIPAARPMGATPARYPLPVTVVTAVRKPDSSPRRNMFTLGLRRQTSGRDRAQPTSSLSLAAVAPVLSRSRRYRQRRSMSRSGAIAASSAVLVLYPAPK